MRLGAMAILMHKKTKTDAHLHVDFTKDVEKKGFHIKIERLVVKEEFG